MKKFLIYCIFIVLSSSVHAQLLWEVSGKGLRQKSYIFATEKLIPISFLDSIPKLYECYAKCPVVITEMLLNPDAREQTEKAALLPHGQNIANLYSKEDYEFIDSTLSHTLKIDFSYLSNLRPIFLTELYKTELYKTHLNFQEEHSSEMFFQLVATEQGRKIIPLDNTIETTHMTFYRKNIDTQATELLRLLLYPDAEIRQAKEIVRLYKKGLLYDIAYAIQAPSNKTSFNYADYLFIKQRNNRWISQLDVLMKGQSCFIVLNAAYLGGDEGLLQLLRKEGFRVKRVN
ncbi:MAG: TraB/GumN family protein [Paludibacteraceae bacterium]|nr:TraB/GumN family protein [Paludibacteraceae bacterium]